MFWVSNKEYSFPIHTLIFGGLNLQNVLGYTSPFGKQSRCKEKSAALGPLCVHIPDCPSFKGFYCNVTTVTVLYCVNSLPSCFFC